MVVDGETSRRCGCQRPRLRRRQLHLATAGRHRAQGAVRACMGARREWRSAPALDTGSGSDDTGTAAQVIAVGAVSLDDVRQTSASRVNGFAWRHRDEFQMGDRRANAFAADKNGRGMFIASQMHQFF